jgi:hypothetical protein
VQLHLARDSQWQAATAGVHAAQCAVVPGLCVRMPSRLVLMLAATAAFNSSMACRFLQPKLIFDGVG